MLSHVQQLTLHRREVHSGGCHEPPPPPATGAAAATSTSSASAAPGASARTASILAPAPIELLAQFEHPAAPKLINDSLVSIGWRHVPVVLQLTRSIAPLKSREVESPAEEQFQSAMFLSVVAPGGEQELHVEQLCNAPAPVAPSCQRYAPALHPEAGRKAGHAEVPLQSQPAAPHSHELCWSMPSGNSCVKRTELE